MNSEIKVTIGDDLRCLFKNGEASRLGFLPGTEWVVEVVEDGVAFRRLDDNLLKVYVEATNACNLDCRTCVRNVWEEEQGWMSDETFTRLLTQLGELPAVKTVHFGGYGEPLAHPRIYEWLRRVKDLGLRTEIITNGTLLNPSNCDKLVAADVDLVVVSIDGASGPTYDGIRLGSQLQTVIRNIKNLAAARYRVGKRRPDLGLSFVAMKDNLQELLDLKRMSRQLRASFIMVTNLLPHTEEMQQQVLYGTLATTAHPRSPRPTRRDPMVSLPRVDFSPETTEVIRRLIRGQGNIKMAGMDLFAGVHYCRFVQEGNAFVRWDGAVTPCMPLLHTHQVYILGRRKRIVAHSFGSINESSVAAIWDSGAYRDFRGRVRRFEFSPCVDCGGCEMSESNQEDCFGNPAPVCGECLWAQGIVQCP